MKSLISLENVEGFKDPIDFNSTKQHGESFWLKNIGFSSNKRTITYCSDFFVNFDTSWEQFLRNKFLLSTFSEVETLINGKLKIVIYYLYINSYLRKIIKFKILNAK